VLLKNTRRWLPETATIRVGIGLSSSFLVTINKYEAIDAKELDHISWRIDKDKPLQRLPSPPWGLSENLAHLEGFIDSLIPELFQDEFKGKGRIWAESFQIAYRRSQDSTRKDVCYIPMSSLVFFLANANRL
jgi:hypothetical protein